MYKTEERTPDWDFDDAEFLGLAPFEGSGSTGYMARPNRKPQTLDPPKALNPKPKALNPQP